MSTARFLGLHVQKLSRIFYRGLSARLDEHPIVTKVKYPQLQDVVQGVLCPTATSVSTGAEDREHNKIKKNVKTILERCGFTVDSEVTIRAAVNEEDERTFDVCAMFQLGGKEYLLVIECRNRPSLDHPNTETAALQEWRHRILEDKDNVSVVSNEDHRISTRRIRSANEVRFAYAFTEKLEEGNFRLLEGILKSKRIVLWNHRAVRYYDRTSSTLGSWTRFEIYREFRISESHPDTHYEPAVKITQPGSSEIFVLGMPPGLLLRIGYVTRRVSHKPEAYQRAINKDRINAISKFLRSRGVLLPNSVIIAFDEDKDIQSKIAYDENRGTLSFPVQHCSAWIIDGQHRVYGFKDTKYNGWPTDQDARFKLPTVAFRKLDNTMQTETFVNINYYQKKIDPTLFCDLAAATGNLRSELAWPALLVLELNRRAPWKGRVKTGEFDTRKSITLSGFARFALLDVLLHYNKSNGQYEGSLFRLAPFFVNLKFRNRKNRAAFDKQVGVLGAFFKAVRNSVRTSNTDRDPWENFRRYALTKTTGVNALLLVLARILEKHGPSISWNQYLHPLGQIDFSSKTVVEFGGGWKGFRGLANHIIRRLNKENNDRLTMYRRQKKRKKR